MLDLTENSDFGKIGAASKVKATIENPYTDFNANDMSTVAYGENMLDTCIQNVLCTFPGERLFNVNFSSPAYEILFENYTAGIESRIYDCIETVVPVTIARSEAYINFDANTHVLSVSIPYVSNDGRIASVFKRRIRK